MRWALIVLGLTLGFGNAGRRPALAQTKPNVSGAISLERYLQVVQTHHPKLASAKAKWAGAREKIRAAKGAYDPKLSLASELMPLGRYRFGAAGVKVSALTPFWGLSAFAQYRFGWATFPVYRAEQKTGKQGTVKAGLSLPILADRKIDPARASLAQSTFGAGEKGCGYDEVRLDLLRDAASVYWEWIQRALEVGIKKELLSVAQERAFALQTRHKNGAIAAVVLLDNQRLIIARESKLIEAQRKLDNASIKMSLYWRDTQGEPLVAQDGQAPADLVPPHHGATAELAALARPSQREIDDAMLRMPELCRLAAQISSAQIQVKLRKNQRLPQLDLQGYAARWLGDDAALAATDVGVGLQFSLALGLRKATGKWRAAQAQLEALLQENRQLRDQIVASLSKARVDLLAAHRQLDIATRKVQLSEQMAQAERTKFTQGASDLILVNLREQAQADALRDRVVAWANYEKAKILHHRALGLDPLGRKPVVHVR